MRVFEALDHAIDLAAQRLAFALGPLAVGLLVRERQLARRDLLLELRDLVAENAQLLARVDDEVLRLGQIL